MYFLCSGNTHSPMPACLPTRVKKGSFMHMPYEYAAEVAVHAISLLVFKRVNLAIYGKNCSSRAHHMPGVCGIKFHFQLSNTATIAESSKE